MSEYKPDRWLIVKIEVPEKTIYKVFGTWLGGYLGAEAWRMNSGNKSVDREGPFFYVKGYSGSVYVLHREHYGASAYTGGVITEWSKRAPDGATLKILTMEEALEYLEERAFLTECRRDH